MKKILIKNVNIIDGSVNGEVINNKDILICGDLITSIQDCIVDEEALIIDGSGKYIMPGLINLHAHLPASGKVGKSKIADKSKLVNFLLSNKLTKSIAVKLCKKYAKVELQSGVTTVRAVGGVGDVDTILRDKINNGKVIGPRLIVCNTAIGVDGGHMDGTVAKGVHSIEECIERVNKLKEEGVDMVKLMITGGVLDATTVGYPGVLRMTQEYVTACCDEAHKLGLKVCAHVESIEGMQVAINAHVDTIEHGCPVDDNHYQTLKEYGGCIVATISPTLPLVVLDPKDTPYGEVGQVNGKVVAQRIVNCAKDALNRGIRVGLGNDVGSPYTPHYCFYKELVNYVKYCGVSNAFALHTGTFINASIIGLEKEIGLVKVGYKADLLLLDSNPLEDLNSLGNIRTIFHNGKIVKGKNKKIESIDKVLEMVDNYKGDLYGN